MNKKKLNHLLKKFKKGQITAQDMHTHLKIMPYEDLGYAKIDHHRSIRKGMPEVIFCQGKAIHQIIGIAKKLNERGSDILATRADSKVFKHLKKILKKAKYHKEARIIHQKQKPEKLKGKILIITAGTADIPVAEEAAVTAEFLGNKIERLYDVGVAGLQRLLKNLPKIHKSKVIITVAGMEGALPSVIAGLTDKPIIAVPTSVGYGASFKGLAALLTMLNCCSPGVTVVNIDNGFGAAYFASTINQIGEK